MSVARVANRREDRAFAAAMEHVVPVRLTEKGVGLDARGSATDVTEAARSIDGTKRANDVLGVFGEGRVLGEDDGLL